MKCYLCNELPSYCCSCTNPPKLLCMKDLQIHHQDKSKNHTFTFIPNPLEIQRKLLIKKKLQMISQIILDDISNKIIELKNYAKKYKNRISDMIKITEKNLDASIENEIFNKFKDNLDNYFEIAQHC